MTTATELVDLSTMRPSKSGFAISDFIILVTMGGLGYLAKEAITHFFPGAPTIEEQLRALSLLVEACGHAGAKSLKVRLTVDAQHALQLHLPSPVKDAKVLAKTDNKIDLEITFKESPA